MDKKADPVAAARGRPRSEAARTAILEAAYGLMDAGGFERLTMEGIAARAGVGKATLYRWWASKSELAMEALLAHVSPAIRFPVTASVRADVKAQMHLLAAAYRSGAGAIVKELIAFSQSDPRTLEHFMEGYLQPRRDAAAQALERGIRSGEFRRDLDLDATIDALYGPLFYRMLLGHAVNDAAFVEGVAEVVLTAAASGRRTRARSKN